ncbi:MAG: cobalamin-dependent protein [Anaerolineae bacterium]|nr:cobalamin-dependent protein [Anaerolineae bacterium]
MTTTPSNGSGRITPRARVNTALNHQQPDRAPVDFLATPEIWARLIEHLKIPARPATDSDFYDPTWETVLQHFEIDCRVISYDQFYQPPDSVLHPGAKVDWWDALSRSTPNRMWRQRLPNGDWYDIWGHHIRIVKNPTGAYEEFATWPLKTATSLDDLKNYAWPNPDWWDFSPLPAVIQKLDAHDQYHLRFRIGSIFEIAWQLRGLQEFLMDLVTTPSIPLYIMDRLTDVYVENTRRVLELAGDRLDMVYFYDDVATQNSLMISRDMWRNYIRPRHARLIEVAKSFGLKVMYHCDGAIYPLVPELLDLGVDVLNPVQADAKGMEPPRLKAEFGDRLCFHGGIDIIKTLPRGTVEDVRNEVKERIQVLGQQGGYVLASSHHIQSDTPLENVLAMYDLALRYDQGQAPAPVWQAQTQVTQATAADEEQREEFSEEAEELLDTLYNAVIDGDRPLVKEVVPQLLAASMTPDVILYDGMIPAMREVGRQFEIGSCFVPEMLVAANAMQAGLDILKPLLVKSEIKPIAKAAIGTVQSDIHDIGKNMVIMMLQGAGFEVVDLGVNTPPEKFIQAVNEGTQLVGMSALLTTTMVNIPMTINRLAEAGVRDRVKIIIGGAPITQEFAAHAGADGFAADASQAVTIAKALLGV